MAEYYIHEDGDAEIGFTWDLFQKDGERVIRVGTFYGEATAEKVVSSLKWYETLEDGAISIPKEKKQKALKIVFTPEKKKAKR